jgi:hypothetical protein
MQKACGVAKEFTKNSCVAYKIIFFPIICRVRRQYETIETLPVFSDVFLEIIQRDILRMMGTVLWIADGWVDIRFF